MPAISINETDFMVLATAANRAHRSGDHDAAQQLDKLARMANAALTRNTQNSLMRFSGMPRTELRWQDMPSTLMDD